MKINASFRPLTVGGSDGLDLLVCLPLAKGGVPHGFSLRRRRMCGTGEPFGLQERDKADREELARGLGLAKVVHMRQVHGKQVEVISKPRSVPPACDGLITAQRGIALLVQTADCVPLLMWDARQNAVAAIHAGWRGTLARVARQAVSSFREQFAADAQSIHVAMGPAIGPCCYEVGEEVFRAYTEQLHGSEDLFSPGSRGRKHLDLFRANRSQLTEGGVPSGQIYSSDFCTSCEDHLLYSYRKEGKGVGRLMAMVGVVPSDQRSVKKDLPFLAGD